MIYVDLPVNQAKNYAPKSADEELMRSCNKTRIDTFHTKQDGKKHYVLILALFDFGIVVKWTESGATEDCDWGRNGRSGNSPNFL